MSSLVVGASTWKSREYEVFINHRGPDVKKTFVAHLYAALSNWGIKIRPFLDAEDIPYGHDVFEEIDKALEGVCVHVAIFSKGYAESIYCLDELCVMLESKQLIIPVFYDVEAANLRRPEDGPFKDAFIKHEERGRTEKIPRWKEALHKVADYRAFRMDKVNENEHELIRRIVEEVRKALPPDLLPGKRIGLEKSMKDVVNKLQSVSVIGLVGMGGIGKTTFAMEVYNHFVSCQRFEHYCFLQDVRSSQTFVLQNKVLRNLGVGSESRCNDQAEYTRKLRGALKGRRVLVIVDDIDDANQLDSLIPDINELGSECRIVITSRRHDVLQDAMKTLPTASKAMYEVRTLDKSYSRRLFNMHAFGSETPSEGFVELAETISDACDGLPLSLTVMGRYLFHKKKHEDKEIWVESVKLLQENQEILDKLRICYDGLPTNGDRAMFLDIACMLIGVKQEVAMTIWKSCSNCSCSFSKTPASSLRRLIDRSLVKLDEYDTLRMHDVLRDMGRDVVKRDRGQARPRKKWTHLWDPVIAEQELGRGKVNTKTRGICLTIKDPDIEDGFFPEPIISFQASKLGRMQELHLLRVDGCNMVHNGSCSGYQQLRWVQWRSYRFRSFPPQLELPQLVVLDLSYSDELRCLWEENIYVVVKLANLVLLDLTKCTFMTRLWGNNANIQLPRLEVLILEACWRLVGLPSNFGKSVPKLKRLKTHRCTHLKTLPNSIGLLANLVVLDLSVCNSLTCLWKNNANIQLPQLEVLNLNACMSLVGLPNNLVMNILKFKRLEMIGCSNLKTLPNSIGLLAHLVVLDLTNCRSFTRLWGNDANIQLPRLEVLILEGSERLVGLPSNFGMSVPKLKRLEMSGCSNLKTLPNSVGLLAHLVVLDLTNCGNLTCLWENDANIQLPRLEVLDLKWCESFVGLPNNFGRSVPKLKRLEMSGCSNLKTLPNSIVRLTELEHWDLSRCVSLTTLPNSIGGLVRLKKMNLRNISNLKEIPMELGRLINLEELNVYCDKDFDMQIVGELKGLKLKMQGNVPAGFNRLKALTHLYIQDGEDVSTWLRNSLEVFTALRSLHMKQVEKLFYIPQSLGKLKSLLHMQIIFCMDLRIIEALPECLEHLDLRGCCSLIEIPSLKPMKSLVHLDLEHCHQLRHINGLECLTTLEFINLVNCATIEDDGVIVNKDNNALRECDVRISKVGVAYNNGWLEDGPLHK